MKATRDKGLILNPPKDANLDIKCFVDADFAGLWSKEEEQDPHCVRSRTGFVVTIAGCPILWKSKMQTEIARSTMESEYIALSTACRDILPLQRMVSEVGQAVGIPTETLLDIKSTIWEDNEACLKLANLELPYMTNRSKHIAIKYHWFRQHVGTAWSVHPISSKEQLADLFTKGFTGATFEGLRLRLMGW